MSIVAIFDGSYCSGLEIAEKIAAKLDYKLVKEDDILQLTSQRHNISVKKLQKALYGDPSVFNDFTHEKERNITFIQLDIALSIRNDNIVYYGSSAHLIPKSLTHVLRSCIIADIDYRAGRAATEKNISNKDAVGEILKGDTALNTLTQYVFAKKPWDSELYDLVIPINDKSIDEIVDIVVENSHKSVVRTTDESLGHTSDFVLASLVGKELALAGHDVTLACKNGIITITIDKYVLRLKALEDELKRIAMSVKDVKGVETKVGKNFSSDGSYYKRFDGIIPSKVLVVDDEKDFAQTLSRRLQLRDVGAAAVYDGGDALSFVKREEPDVIVLDLNMPGVNGLEVLERVKRENPDIEVIILTGHGSEEEKSKAEGLGAYTYLQKPVDIEKLTMVMKDAYNKIRQEKATARVE